MANEDAWNAGWNIGMKSAAGRKKKKKGAARDTGKAADTGKIAPTGDLKATPGSYKKGGKVRRSGMAKVHKGEIVLTAAQAKMCTGKPTKKKGARKRIATKA